MNLAMNANTMTMTICTFAVRSLAVMKLRCSLIEPSSHPHIPLTVCGRRGLGRALG
jgi:hypothetical protein